MSCGVESADLGAAESWRPLTRPRERLGVCSSGAASVGAGTIDLGAGVNAIDGGCTTASWGTGCASTAANWSWFDGEGVTLSGRAAGLMRGPKREAMLGASSVASPKRSLKGPALSSSLLVSLEEKEKPGLSLKASR